MHKAGFIFCYTYVMASNIKYLVGIDEVGRGPLAGPVTVCSVLSPQSLDLIYYFGKVKDSKKLSEKKREALFDRLKEARQEGVLKYVVSSVSPKVIDRIGISHALRLAIARSLNRLNTNPMVTRVLLDGGLKAPETFYNQQTIIRGDETEPIIGLASIVAKVTRDRYMIRMADHYPQYNFELHKGYGTKVHREAIQKYGLSDMHRSTFCTRLYKD